MRVNEKSVCCYVVDARTSSCTIEHDANAVRLYFIETKDALVADARCLSLKSQDSSAIVVDSMIAEKKNIESMKKAFKIGRASCRERV